MSAIITLPVSPASALPPKLDAALERLARIAPDAAPEIVHACTACGSCDVQYFEVDSPAAPWGAIANDAGWHCKACGADGYDVDDLVVMPVATFLALTEVADLAAPLAGTAMRPDLAEQLALSVALVEMRRGISHAPAAGASIAHETEAA